MRQVILYGELGRRFGREHNLSVRSASEAIQAMCINFPDFKKFLSTAHKSGVGFKVFVGKSSLKKAEDSLLPSGDSDTIRIAPAVFGSGAVTRIIVGTALIVGGAFLTGVSLGGGITLGGVMIQTGAALVLGGVAELIAGSPKTGSDQSGLDINGQSFIFSGPENVTRQGGAVPVGYGRVMVGSTVISAGIENEDQ